MAGIKFKWKWSVRGTDKATKDASPQEWTYWKCVQSNELHMCEEEEDEKSWNWNWKVGIYR